MKLEHKLAFVSGGASGLGRGGATAFLKAGCRVAIFDMNTAQGASAEAELAGQFGKDKVKFFRLDVTDENAAREAIAAAVAHFGAYP